MQTNRELGLWIATNTDRESRLGLNRVNDPSGVARGHWSGGVNFYDRKNAFEALAPLRNLGEVEAVAENISELRFDSLAADLLLKSSQACQADIVAVLSASRNQRTGRHPFWAKAVLTKLHGQYDGVDLLDTIADGIEFRCIAKDIDVGSASSMLEAAGVTGQTLAVACQALTYERAAVPADDYHSDRGKPLFQPGDAAVKALRRDRSLVSSFFLYRVANLGRTIPAGERMHARIQMAKQALQERGLENRHPLR